MATFHPFLCLPYELRAQIWEYTVEPRTVTAYFIPRVSGGEPILHTNTPVPAVLQTCREARSLKFYKKVFSDLRAPLTPDENETDPDVTAEAMSQEHVVSFRETPGYVWVNLAIDTIDIGPTLPSLFLPAAASTSVLKLMVKLSKGERYPNLAHLFEVFPNLDEAYTRDRYGIDQWA